MPRMWPVSWEAVLSARRRHSRKSVSGSPLRGATHKRTREAMSVVLEGRSVFSHLNVDQNLALARASAEEAYEMFPELRARRNVAAGDCSLISAVGPKV